MYAPITPSANENQPLACALAFASAFCGVLAIGTVLRTQAPAPVQQFAAPVARPARVVMARPATPQPGHQLGRREVLAGIAAAAAMPATVLPQRAQAAYGSGGGGGDAVATYTRFYGAATPNAGYGGGLVGGNGGVLGGVSASEARYGYETNVATWKEVAVDKLDKGVGGIDSRWSGPSGRRAFVLTRLATAEAQAMTPDQVIKSLSGAEPNLQEAFKNGQVTATKTTVKGVDFMDFDVSGGAYHYIIRTGYQSDRLFALFVSAPEASFAADEANLRRTVGSFELYKQA